MHNRTLVALLSVALAACGWAAEKGAGSPKGVEAKGGTTIEYVAWCPAANGYLDGPAFEATGSYRMGLGAGQIDDAGNIWWGGRCLVASNGAIRTVYGDDAWCSYFPVDEGPAATYSGYNVSAGFGWVAGDATFQGNPLARDGKGCLYVSTATRVTKIWQNPDKGGRWWFKKIIGEGPTPAPQSKGESIGALDAKLSVGLVSVHPGNRLIIYGGGSFYEYKDGKLLCLMGFKDYSANVPVTKKIDGQHAAGLGVMGGDGMFYVGYYFSPGVPRVDRIHPDGKVELYLEDHYNRCQDGVGSNMGMFCGPHIWTSMNNYNYIPGDCLVLQSHDDQYLRRTRNGRVATLCTDGEWHELSPKDVSRALPYFRNWNPGPNGTASVMNDRICKGLTFLVRGIDYNKAVTGPLQEGAGSKNEVKAGATGEVKP
jgi:hypothetical protein